AAQKSLQVDAAPALRRVATGRSGSDPETLRDHLRRSRRPPRGSGRSGDHARAEGRRVDAVSLALPAEGGCQCGAIRYRLTGEPVFLTICHCGECKRQSGSAFGMSMRMRWSDVEITGQPKRWVRPADSGATVTCA